MNIINAIALNLECFREALRSHCHPDGERKRSTRYLFKFSLGSC